MRRTRWPIVGIFQGALLCAALAGLPARAYTFSASAPAAASPVSDSPNSLFIDRDGTFFIGNSLSQYDDNPANHYWKFFIGQDADSVTESAAHSQYDTRVLCNDKNPVAIDLFGTPVKSQTGYSQADYCDLIGVWVDPDTSYWYGVVHNELFGNNPRVDAISYAISTDRGASWTLQEPIITSPYGKGNPNTPYYYYGAGDPRLFVDNASGYFYLFYTSRILGQNGNPVGFDDHMWEHVARAPISKKMAPSSWQKFYNGRWQQVSGTNWTCDPLSAAAPCTAAPVSSALESNVSGPTLDLRWLGGPSADRTGGQTFVPPPPGPGNLLGAGYTNGTMRVMSVAWNVYMQKYIAIAEDKQAGTLKFYMSDDLSTQQWRFAGYVPYNSSSWYRWFTDSATKTSADTLGSTFRVYCVVSCSKSNAEYIDVTVQRWQFFDPVPVYYSNANGVRVTATSQPKRYYIVHPGNPAGNLPTAAAGAWTLTPTADGFFTLQIGGRYLGVGAGNAGRMWGAPTVLSSSAGTPQQQWYFQKIGGDAAGGYRIINRYSGLALSFTNGALTSDLLNVVTVPIRSWIAPWPTPIHVWGQDAQSLQLVAQK
ncbi:RICIN domain-containing protein [Burkholderia sp. TSV86]|uniref:RICIN domain-containing protein n=1 Tax=Burkholderia sp. TSV86 TaxID=1385594 RepID=UPI000A64A22B|nr:RICIN domain-containing protein [Burkholderia sp. TSV86]